MILNKRTPPKFSLIINGESVKNVQKFIYLSSLITSDGNEIMKRITLAKNVFKN